MNSQLRSTYMKIMREHFPNVSRAEIEVFTEGNDHNVFVINHEVAFRFPKVAREIDPKRANFLNKFAQQSPIPLPTITIHQHQTTGICYEINKFLPGVSFDPALALSFPRHKLMRVAQELGTFLSALHAFPLDEARSLEVDEMDPKDFWAYMAQNPHAYPHLQAFVFPHLIPSEQRWVEGLFEAYITQIRATPFPICVTHSDMWVFHIIVDPLAHTLSGVIDFWVRIADPARDFKAFEHYGQDFVTEVYRHYHAPVDGHFEQRRLFYMAYDLLFELDRALSRTDPQKIALCKHALSTYIATHPLILGKG